VVWFTARLFDDTDHTTALAGFLRCKHDTGIDPVGDVCDECPRLCEINPLEVGDGFRIGVDHFVVVFV